MMRGALAVGAALLLASARLAHAQTLSGASPESMAALARGEWPAYAGTYASAKYSPLDQITPDNVAGLRIAWRWTSPDHAVRAGRPTIDASYAHEGTPLMVNGTLYTSTSLSQVAAIDAATGKTKWVFDPHSYRLGKQTNLGWLHRGVGYWRDGEDERVIIATGHAFLIALDARTGRPVESFGKKGRVDLTEGHGRPVDRAHYGNTSPPVIVRDVIVVGSTVQDYPSRWDMPPGDVRGFDVRSGRKLWTFRSVPGRGEPGNETWEHGSWRYAGAANVWAPMSADEELGYVYLPFSTPVNDYYGGQRHGDNLFGESLVCVDARTGARIWHYQIVRHGLWDYDLPAAPNLMDVTVDGRRVKAVAQVTKQGFVFAFDRVTGQPLWPIEDRPVPQSRVRGEKTAATQPFPTRPAPFEIQGVREEDLVDGGLEIVKRYEHGPLYTPPSEGGTIAMPGQGGGASWSGAALDPDTAMYYVTTRRVPMVITLSRPRGDVRDDYVGRARYLSGPGGWPLFKPPFSSIVAIDMSNGEHRWRAAVGYGAQRGFALVTKTVLLVAQSSLYAYDKASGNLLATIPLPASASGAPMTYLAGGKQYVVFPTGGAGVQEELIALALP